MTQKENKRTKNEPKRTKNEPKTNLKRTKNELKTNQKRHKNKLKTNQKTNNYILRMSGAYSKPMPWAGGGATKPPMANNYLDSHGLNAGQNF